jgi:hypothetical protein
MADALCGNAFDGLFLLIGGFPAYLFIVLNNLKGYFNLMPQIKSPLNVSPKFTEKRPMDKQFTSTLK